MVQAPRHAERLLVIIDNSSGSKRAVEYLAAVIGRRRGFHVHLLHLLSPLPPELVEFGGAEDPQKEQQLQAELRHDQKAWIASARNAAKAVLGDATEVLRRAGISAHEISLGRPYPTESRDAARTVLNEARSKRCHTIVIGHESHSWFRELVGGHLAEHLLREARGLTIWVVQ